MNICPVTKLECIDCTISYCAIDSAKQPSISLITGPIVKAVMETINQETLITGYIQHRWYHWLDSEELNLPSLCLAFFTNTIRPKV